MGVTKFGLRPMGFRPAVVASRIARADFGIRNNAQGRGYADNGIHWLVRKGESLEAGGMKLAAVPATAFSAGIADTSGQAGASGGLYLSLPIYRRFNSDQGGHLLQRLNWALDPQLVGTLNIPGAIQLEIKLKGISLEFGIWFQGERQGADRVTVEE